MKILSTGLESDTRDKRLDVNDVKVCYSCAREIRKFAACATLNPRYTFNWSCVGYTFPKYGV